MSTVLSFSRAYSLPASRRTTDRPAGLVGPIGARQALEHGCRHRHARRQLQVIVLTERVLLPTNRAMTRFADVADVMRDRIDVAQRVVHRAEVFIREAAEHRPRHDRMQRFALAGSHHGNESLLRIRDAGFVPREIAAECAARAAHDFVAAPRAGLGCAAPPTPSDIPCSRRRRSGNGQVPSCRRGQAQRPAR